MILSDKLRTNIRKAIAENCVNVTDGCVQSVKRTVTNPDTELEARQLAIGSVVISVLVAALSIAISYSSGALSNKEIPVAYNVHDDVLSQASKAVTSSTIPLLSSRSR